MQFTTQPNNFKVVVAIKLYFIDNSKNTTKGCIRFS